jgi:hypothetical protein
MSVLAVVPTIMTAIYAGTVGLVVVLGMSHVVLRRLEAHASASRMSAARGGGRDEVRSTIRRRG